jgi:2-dehydropantoate 2-reductase
MRVAIVGVGSLGTIIGALMIAKGKSVDLIDAYKENVDALNAKGASITGFMELNVPVKAFTPEQMTGKYDLVFLLNKQTTNAVVLKNLLPFLHEKSTVCTLQNGIPEDSVAAVVGREKTIGGAVGFGATWLEPGVSMLTTSREAVEKFAFEIGELDGVDRPRLAQVQEHLQCVGRTEILTDLIGIRYSKVLMNATFSGMSAALGCTFGDVLADPKAMTCLAFIADECIKVSHAHGVWLAKMQGEDFQSFEFGNPREIPSKMPLYTKIWSKHVKLKASMLQDLEKGRDCEIDYINGIICKKGREKNVPTPFNDKVVELVTEAQSRRGVNDFSYLSRFDGLLEQYAKGIVEKVKL